jgi:hypothetical protein
MGLGFVAATNIFTQFIPLIEKYCYTILRIVCLYLLFVDSNTTLAGALATKEFSNCLNPD